MAPSWSIRPAQLRTGRLGVLDRRTETGWTFVRWYGEQDSVKNATTLGVNRNATITAVFHAVHSTCPMRPDRLLLCTPSSILFLTDTDNYLVAWPVG